jgi:iron(III) transport system substrate-binding protein
MKRWLPGALLGVMLIAACDSGDVGPPPAAVVVYATPELEDRLLERFAGFTTQTRIPVTLKVADGESNSRNVIDNRGMPPADVLITANVADIWRAADEGALRPLTATGFHRVPTVLRDPDGTWAAIAVRYAVIVAAADADARLVDDYADLATAALRGKLCVSSSGLPVNRSLIAMLIEDTGVKPTERMVRAWVRNLAASPFSTERKLIDALQSGPCKFGVVSSSIAVEGLQTITPDPLYLDIDAIGVARHAPQAESAQALVQWMLESSPLPEPRSSNGRNAGIAGWREEDVRLLVERAGYR